MKKIFIFIITLLILSGCTNEVVNPEGINISGENKVEINKTTQLEVDTNKNVIWSSDNPEIATVINGEVRGISLGQVIIRVHLEEEEKIFDTFLINVVEEIIDPITPLTITGPTQVIVDQEIKLSVDSDNVYWSSSDETIAIVDGEGSVFGISQGKVTIKAEEQDKPQNFATIEIEVVLEGSYNYYKTKILSIDEQNNKIELLNVPYTNYTNNTKFLKYDNILTQVSIEEFYIGLENIYVQVDQSNNIITKVMMDKEIGFNNIRVAIRKSINDIADVSSLYHDSITLRLNANTVLQTYDNENRINLNSGAVINIKINNNQITVSQSTNVLIETSKRIIFNPGQGNISITSISRANGTPNYEDNLEISIVNNRLLIVNDIDLEKYLTKVVPSEMPSSWSKEALKSQAVAARTYAYMDILNKSNDKYGYTVDDSVKSQVYNNSNAANSTNIAISETSGLVMLYENSPVQAYYYSASSGITASGHEVWIKDDVIDEIPYLIGQNLTKDSKGNQVTFDYTNEASMLNFFKTIKMNTPDNTTYHRWKFEFNLTQLTNTIKHNLPITYNNAPESVLTKVGDNWESLQVPSNIGDVTDVYVSKRGSSGVVVSLDVVTTTGVYRIVNQYNIRFTIRPKDALSTVKRYSASNTDSTYRSSYSTNDSILLSGFFAIEKSGDNYYFYGGGNGHGVGMSQYGANGLALQGKSYEQILTTYYSNIDLTNIRFNYTALSKETYTNLLK